MPEYRPTATEEIMKRIKSLDKEESRWREAHAKQATQLAVIAGEIEKIANVRRQYEFALKQLGVDEDPKLDNRRIAVIAEKIAPGKVPVRVVAER